MSENPTPHNNDDATPLAKLMFGWTSAKWAPGFMFILTLVVAIGLLAADFIIHRHAYEPVEFSLFPMFYGLYGFGAFFFVVLCGWPLGRMLRKDENFYGDQAGLDDASKDEGEA